jgi:hypothetical protein
MAESTTQPEQQQHMEFTLSKIENADAIVELERYVDDATTLFAFDFDLTLSYLPIITVKVCFTLVKLMMVEKERRMVKFISIVSKHHLFLSLSSINRIN